MNATEPQQERPNLAALKIEREEESYEGRPVGKIITWIVLLVLVGIGAWYGYQRLVVPRSAPVVETTTVKATINVANPALLSATGYLVADRQSKITPKISGKVLSLPIDTGMRVRRGDVLAVLESTNLQAQLDEANATYEAAKREYDRELTLFKQGIASKSLFDNAEASVKTARARVNQIKINMQDMVVRAPFDGTIATKNTEVGEVISSVTMGQVAGTLPAGAICTIVDLKTLKVEADVNEGSIGQLHPGQPAEVTVDAFPNRKFRGQLQQIIPTADRAKAIVKVKVAILDPIDGLLPEMSSNVSFLQAARTDQELNETARIWLPTSALADGHVAVIDATHHITERAVTTGVTREGRIEIVSGLRDGEKVVTDNRESIHNGQLVRLTDDV